MRPGCPSVLTWNPNRRTWRSGWAVALLGDVFGIEGEWSQSPGFFQARDQELVASSSAQTFTGSVIVAMPRRIAQYSLRPYFVGGAGVMRLRSVDGRPPVSGLFSINETLAAMNVGGGATGFFNERVGVAWDLRYFRSISGESAGIRRSPLMGWPRNFLFGAQTWRSY